MQVAFVLASIGKMGRKGKKEPKQHQVGDFVFAKVRGFRAWPARILQTEGKLQYVYFYGTCNIAKVGLAQLFEYDKCKMRLGDVRRGVYNGFKEAMQHVEQSKSDPDADQGYFRARQELASEQGDSSAPSTPTKDELVKLRRRPFKHITGDSD